MLIPPLRRSMLPMGCTPCLSPGPSEKATDQVCCLLGGTECELLKKLGIWNLGASQGTGCHQEPGSVPWVLTGSSSKKPVSPVNWVSFCRKGISSGVPGLWHKTESLPSACSPDWTWICSVHGESLGIVPCAQTKHPSIEAEPPNDHNASCLCLVLGESQLCHTPEALALVVSMASFLLYLCFFTRCLSTHEASVFTLYRLSS